MKKFLSILLVFGLLLSLCGCAFLEDMTDLATNIVADEKTFEFDGLSIELTTDFLRMDFISEDYDFVVGDATLSIMGIKMAEGQSETADITIREFAENFRDLMAAENSTEITPITEIDGIPMLQYKAPAEDGSEQTIAVAFYKGSNCFWAICFGAATEDFAGLYDDICKYAKTVKIQ